MCVEVCFLQLRLSLQVTQIAETASRRAADEVQRQQQLQQGGWVRRTSRLCSDSHAAGLAAVAVALHVFEVSPGFTKLLQNLRFAWHQ